MNINYITIIGLVAAICTTVSSLPQAIKVVKTRQTRDLSLGMYWILIVGISLWGVYGIFIKDLPLILANLFSFLLAATILIFKIKYK